MANVYENYNRQNLPSICKLSNLILKRYRGKRYLMTPTQRQSGTSGKIVRLAEMNTPRYCSQMASAKI